MTDAAVGTKGEGAAAPGPGTDDAAAADRDGGAAAAVLAGEGSTEPPPPPPPPPAEESRPRGSAAGASGVSFGRCAFPRGAGLLFGGIVFGALGVDSVFVRFGSKWGGACIIGAACVTRAESAEMPRDARVGFGRMLAIPRVTGRMHLCTSSTESWLWGAREEVAVWFLSA